MKFDILYRSRWWLLYIPIVLVCILLLWLSYTQWMPQPPTKITIAAGQTGDGYTQIALRYRERLSQLGIEADVLTDDASHNALYALKSDPPRAQLALASGLHASKVNAQLTQPSTDPKSSDATNIIAARQLQGLAAIEREPVWIFTRVPLMTRVQELRNLRVGITANDQLAPGVAQLVLQQAQLKTSDVRLIKVPRLQLANQLIDGQLDAVILLASSQNEAVRVLTRSPYIQILGLEQVRGMVQREPRLRPFVLPQGVIEFRGDIPPRDLTMVASDLQLVIHANMHPALQRALLDVANQLHETPNFLQRQGEFPNIVDVDFPVSPVAIASVRGSKPWLEQLLPYRRAQLAQWLLLAFLPILICTLLLLAWIPSWFDWRINAMLQNFYGELKFLETEIEPVASERPIEIQRLMHRIDAIDMQVMQLDLPNQFAPRWYTLRSHLADAREKLLAYRAR
jgi:TRAP-type uncharacterized transport system substrate-binding protein